MGVIEWRWLAGWLAIVRPALAGSVKHHHPVPHDLGCHATCPGRFGAACAVLTRCQGQQSPRLLAVFGRAYLGQHLRRVEIGSEPDRHDGPRTFTMFESKPHRAVRARESQPLTGSVLRTVAERNKKTFWQSLPHPA